MDGSGLLSGGEGLALSVLYLAPPASRAGGTAFPWIFDILSIDGLVLDFTNDDQIGVGNWIDSNTSP